MSRLFAFIAVFVLPLNCSLALALERQAHELELKTERVIIFKDGYSLIIKKGIASSDKEGEVFTDDVPDAAVSDHFGPFRNKDD